MNKNQPIYKIKEITDSQKNIVKELINAGIDESLARLYALRDIEKYEDISTTENLIPFTLLKDIGKAVSALRECILKKKKVCIIADYDVDGATACSIGLLGFKMLGMDITYVVPDRFRDGYGLTPGVVDQAIAKKNPDVLVTVDNGVASIDGIKYANSKKIPVIVTDHHLQGDVLPDAYCIVNPNRNDCDFPSKALAGCGVIFYVVCALKEFMIMKGDFTRLESPNINSLLDLVAIGTVADLVKLDKNNRLLVDAGLKMIRRGRTRPGVLALIEVSGGRYEDLTTTDIGFKIGPRLNAAGRLEDMSIGINCLTSSSIDEARELAKRLDSINVDRKEIEKEMKEQALSMPNLSTHGNTRVAYGEEFHEGVIGIVASRLKEMFFRPSIVFAEAETEEKNDGSIQERHLKGSGRSIPNIHLRDALDYVHKKDPKIMVKFGGHAMAAGLTIHKEKYDDFCQLFEEAVTHFANGKDFENIKMIDMDLPTEDISIEMAYKLSREVWGQGFLPPLFMSEFNILDQRLLKEQHLKLRLEKDGLEVDGIWFFHPELLDNTKKVNLVFTLDINTFRGEENVQLMIDGMIENL